jgi:phospholipid/cholesterol/gamma-HCH transport system substrate-binding protein
VKVGRIRKIEIADRHLAQVTFSVDQDVTLPAGTIATIRFRNLVGQRYLTLDRGTGDPTAVLKPGATLPLEQTRPALDLTALFNGFKPLFQALSPNDVNQLSYEIIQVLQGEGGTVDSLLSHTARLTSTIASRDQVIGQLVDNLNSVLGTLNSRTPQLSSTIVTVQQLVSGLAQDRKPIGDAITAIGQLANTTSGFLAAGRAPLKDSIAQLGALTANLNRNQPTVEHFIQNLGP